MKGIIISCEVLYFATFRKPSSTSLILTYSIPPFTTVRGMIANALGLQQHDHCLQDKIKIGIKVIDAGYKNCEMAKVLKLKKSSLVRTKQYPSSPMFREFLVNPKYEFYIGGQENIIKDVFMVLRNPKRPLYLGQSDDLVDVTVSEILDIEELETNEIHSISEKIYPNCQIEKVPYSFTENNGKYSVEYKIVSIPILKYININGDISFKFNNNFVNLY